MRILFSTFGSLGDLHPYLAIAALAKARGHTPVIATSPKYRAKVEAEGFTFRPVRPDLPPPTEFGPLAERVMDSNTRTGVPLQRGARAKSLRELSRPPGRWRRTPIAS